MKKSKLYKVVFEPDGNDVYVPSGTLVSKTAAAGGHAVETPCGGIGVCGKCKVRIVGDVSKPDETEIRHLGDEIFDGFRLACMTKIKGDVRIEIPDVSRSHVQKILCESELRDCCLNPGIKKVYVEAQPPSLDDEKAEFERIVDKVTEEYGIIKPNLNIVRNISKVLRASDYKVTLVLSDDELIAIEPGDTTKKSYGIAYDLGSTTVVGYLMDLNTGDDIGTSAVMNPQMIYGDDLIARISFAATQENGDTILRDAAVDALKRVAEELSISTGISLKNVYKATVVGNTCMTHLLLGIDVNSLGQSPYVPSVSSDICVSASDLGLSISEEAKVFILPSIAGFVGADLVGVVLSNMWKDNGKTRLAVDIGTNGEMALRHNNKLYVCSAAAGPAFEGAGISIGMRGGPGAIDSVKITDDVIYTTIARKKPLGICGSGLVDAIAQMLDSQIIDITGRMISPTDAANLPEAIRNRLIETEKRVEFILVHKKESGTGKNLTLTNQDIRHLQLAKGSIHAAIQTLLKTAGTNDDELDEIMLAGAFGNYIKIESALRIGLIPNISKEKVVSIGNAAGSGSKLALLCEKEMELAKGISKEADHLELAISPDYQMELMERMMFM